MSNKIQVSLEVDDKGSVKLKQFGDEAKKSMAGATQATNMLASGFSKLGPIIAGAFTIGAITSFVQSVIDLGDNLEKTSQRLGIGVTELDKLRKVGELAGVELESLANTMSYLQRKISEAAGGNRELINAFQHLGLDIQKLKNMKPEDQFKIMSERLSQLSNQGNKQQLIMLLMGRAASDMIPLFNSLNKEYERMTSSFTPERTKAMEAFNDKMTDIKHSMVDLFVENSDEIISGITAIANALIWLIGLFGTSKKKTLETLEEGIAAQEQIITSKKGYLTGGLPGLAKGLEDDVKKLEEMKSRRDKIVSELNTEINQKSGTSSPGGKVNQGGFTTQAIRDNLTKIENEIYTRMLLLSGNLEEAEIAAVRTRYAEILKTEGLTNELRKKLEETLQQEITAIHRRYAQQRAIQESEFNEFYRGGSPSETRFMSNKTYQNNPAWNSVDDSIKRSEFNKMSAEEEARILSSMSKSGRAEYGMPRNMAFAYSQKFDDKFYSDREAARRADLMSAAYWLEQMESIYGQSAELTELYYLKVKAINDKHKSDLEKWTESIKSMDEIMEDTLIQAGESFSSGLTDALFEFVDGTKSAKDAFLDFASSFLREIAKMIVQQMILNAVKSSMGGFFGFADGGIIPGGTGQGMPIKGFASGGIVNSPTMAIMGEGRYNEAVVPLPDGRSIPVQMKGGGNNIAINVNVDGSKGGTSEQNQKLGRQIAKEVREEVKKILTDERRYGGILGAQSARTY